MLFNPFLDIDYTYGELTVVTLCYKYQDDMISLVRLFIKFFYVLPEYRRYWVHEYQPIVDSGSIHFHRTINRILKYDKIGFNLNQVWILILCIAIIPSFFAYYIISNLHYFICAIALLFFKKNYPPRGFIEFKAQKKFEVEPNFLIESSKKELDHEKLISFFYNYLSSDLQWMTKIMALKMKEIEVTPLNLPRTPIELLKKKDLYLSHNCMGKIELVLKKKDAPFFFKYTSSEKIVEGKTIGQEFLEKYINSEEVPIYTIQEFTEITTKIDDYNLFVDIISLGLYAAVHVLYFFL